jgi:hypothetical protein
MLFRNVSWLITNYTALYWRYKTQKQTPWPESASELYRPSDRRLSEKLVPTLRIEGCRVVSAAADPLYIDDTPCNCCCVLGTEMWRAISGMWNRHLPSARSREWSQQWYGICGRCTSSNNAITSDRSWNSYQYQSLDERHDSLEMDIMRFALQGVP